jgi:alpha-beta hydrolase superfamily lysophospholipase
MLPAQTSFPAFRRFWSNRRLTVVGSLVALVVLPNFLAYQHARAMTRYSSSGSKTGRPETLSALEKARVLIRGVNQPRPTNGRSPADFGLDHEVHRLHVEQAPTLEVWRIPGERSQPVVVMFHGYGSCKSDLLPEARAFQECGCETILVDFRGSGGSDGNETSLGYHESHDVTRAYDFARSIAAGRPIFLYGRSMGSVAIFRAVATDLVTPEGIIAECPFDRLLSTIEHRFEAMKFPAFPMARLLVFWGGWQQDLNGFEHNPVEYAERIECPTLLLHGENDPRVSVPEIRSIYDSLGGEKQLVLFPDAGHESYLELDADRWRRAVLEFIGGLADHRL